MASHWSSEEGEEEEEINVYEEMKAPWWMWLYLQGSPGKDGVPGRDGLRGEKVCKPKVKFCLHR